MAEDQRLLCAEFLALCGGAKVRAVDFGRSLGTVNQRAAPPDAAVL